ncbi:MAG: aminoacyl-histidine dipeptidase [Chlorobiaceae bacterium]|nr:aminoacyl-histidine dipeptidase [Chlorobiaceae bacterium]NTW10877.1 aminoacyl-histidine dipeptidase [Chlorobiaceae bacterium]
MESIQHLKPHPIWKNFYSLTRIPRPSGMEAEVREFICSFSAGLGLETFVDGSGNVVVRKPATPGMEERKGVILQAHLDMVPQKNSGKVHDFRLDPVETIVEGDWVCADGTTLGADNGIGVAAAMSVLEAEDIRHGPLEALFTVDEESGMSGASGLKPGVLHGEVLLNLDSEDEGELFIGCAGAMNASFSFSFAGERVPDGHQGYRISVTGLKGGHSGMDIHLGRGNANKIMNRLLHHAFLHHGLRLASIEGGSLRNAIPRESFAHIAIPGERSEDFLGDFRVQAGLIQSEFILADPDLQIEAVPQEPPETVLDEKSISGFLKAVHACPDGVIRMSGEMAGLVETSNNLAIVKSAEDSIIVDCLLRSSVDSAKDDLLLMMQSIFELAGAMPSFSGGYPGWKPDRGSPVLKTMQQVYERVFGESPRVSAVHAGLECGLIGAAYPGLDMISFGPTIRYPHSPGEKVHIGSVGKFWTFLVETLGSIPFRER